MNHLLRAFFVSCFFVGQTLAQNPSILIEKPDLTGWSTLELAPGHINSIAGASSPFRYGDKIYFTVSVPRKSGGGKVSRLYSALINDPAIPQLINPKEDDVSAANATLSIGGNRIYYIVTKETTNDKPTRSEIWYRDKEYDGTWGHVVTLPKSINDLGIINQHPSCGFDFSLKKEVLYFSSNRPGGKGGFDIWYCTLNRDGSFSEPINAPFNTAEDDVSPFFYTHAQMIFFSSNRPGGKGGFDVYQSSKNIAETWQPAENLGAVNTTFDELYFTYHQPTQFVYLCSNRPNANCKNMPTGCPELAIFSGKLNSSLIVNTMNLLDSAALYGCNIELENMETGVIETTILRSENSIVELPILPNKKYRLIVSRAGYYPVFLQLQSVSTDFVHPIRKTVYLKPMN